MSVVCVLILAACLCVGERLTANHACFLPARSPGEARVYPISSRCHNNTNIDFLCFRWIAKASCVDARLLRGCRRDTSNRCEMALL